MLSRCLAPVTIWVYAFGAESCFWWSESHRNPPDPSIPASSSVWPQSTYVEAVTECNQAKPQFKSIKCMDVRGLWRTQATRKLLLSSENFQSLFTQQVCNLATEQAVIWSGTQKTFGASRCDSAACLWWLCHGCCSSEYTMRFWHFLA